MRIRNLALAGLAGAAVAYYFHPVEGVARRRRLRGQIERLMSRRGVLRTDVQPMPENVAPTAGASAPGAAPIPAASAPGAAPIPPASAPAASVPAAPASAAPPVVRPTEADTLPENQPDAIIAQRVRQRLQERPDLETSNLMIDVVRGVAYLRGDLRDRGRFDDIIDVTGSVPGVNRVQSLLHLPESETISRPTTRHLGDTWNG
jgi:osmotically-inducible protein OsmY